MEEHHSGLLQCVIQLTNCSDKARESAVCGLSSHRYC